MYTEDEAREKWCPHARLLEPDTERASCNRSLRRGKDGWDEHLDTSCIGSACMAWRWKPLSQTDENTIRGYARDTSREMAEKKFQNQRHGYCGLSGSPSPSKERVEKLEALLREHVEAYEGLELAHVNHILGDGRVEAALNQRAITDAKKRMLDAVVTTRRALLETEGK